VTRRLLRNLQYVLTLAALACLVFVVVFGLGTVGEVLLGYRTGLVWVLLKAVAGLYLFGGLAVACSKLADRQLK
jgi:hypothetical protein